MNLDDQYSFLITIKFKYFAFVNVGPFVNLCVCMNQSREFQTAAVVCKTRACILNRRCFNAVCASKWSTCIPSACCTKWGECTDTNNDTHTPLSCTRTNKRMHEKTHAPLFMYTHHK